VVRSLTVWLLICCRACTDLIGANVSPTSKYRGFVRTMRGEDVGAYYHPSFRRDRKDLCETITSTGSSNSEESELTNPSLALGLATPAMIQHGLVDRELGKIDSAMVPELGSLDPTAALESNPSFNTFSDPFQPTPIHPRLSLRNSWTSSNNADCRPATLMGDNPYQRGDETTHTLALSSGPDIHDFPEQELHLQQQVCRQSQPDLHSYNSPSLSQFIGNAYITSDPNKNAIEISAKVGQSTAGRNAVCPPNISLHYMDQGNKFNLTDSTGSIRSPSLAPVFNAQHQAEAAVSTNNSSSNDLMDSLNYDNIRSPSLAPVFNAQHQAAAAVSTNNSSSNDLMDSLNYDNNIASFHSDELLSMYWQQNQLNKKK
jgi:hypothetical protein